MSPRTGLDVLGDEKSLSSLLGFKFLIVQPIA
jgi:hypothetical protein